MQATALNQSKKAIFNLTLPFRLARPIMTDLRNFSLTRHLFFQISLFYFYLLQSSPFFWRRINCDEHFFYLRHALISVADVVVVVATIASILLI